MVDKAADLKMLCYHFLKTLNIRQNLLSRVLQILFTGMYYLFIPLFLLDNTCLQISFWYEARIGRNSIVNTDPENIFHQITKERAI